MIHVNTSRQLSWNSTSTETASNFKIRRVLHRTRCTHLTIVLSHVMKKSQTTALQLISICLIRVEWAVSFVAPAKAKSCTVSCASFSSILLPWPMSSAKSSNFHISKLWISKPWASSLRRWPTIIWTYSLIYLLAIVKELHSRATKTKYEHHLVY